ncbi:MAG TPA: T9SS type A sorting domain-containing protein, partial [Bacteroidota bacterium]|nr:T9SS type A sorting domain-containing protein [Bacteroidota bacterium]
SINIGDLDGDGLMDLVIGNFYQGNCLSVLQRNSPRGVEISVQPDSLTFGWVRAGTSDTLVLTISNAGTTDSLRISSIVPSKSVFSARPEALVIPPLGSRPISVVYSPKIPGNDSARLAIASNDTSTAVWNVPLSGRSYAITDRPIIKAIVPVSYGDVRIVWFRSIFDSVGAADPVTQYSIWREVPPGTAPGITAQLSVPRPASLSAIDPLWDFIETVPAIELNQYAAVVPMFPAGMIAPPWCTFMVAAQTRSQQVYLSLPDSVQGDPSGVPITIVREGTTQVPRAVVLNQNYPNPFNPSTVIDYGLPRRENVSLVVYNLLGQAVARLVDEVQDAGYYHVRFDGSHLASGAYFCRLRAGENVRTERILLLK